MLEDMWAETTRYVFTQMSHKAARKKFGANADKAVSKELLQLHIRDTFEPRKSEDFTSEEIRSTLESIMTVKQKVRDDPDSLKGRYVADGSKQRGTIPKEETASPTVHTHLVVLTSAVDANKGRDVAVTDLPGAYLSADMKGEEHVHMILRGRVAELMVLTAPQVYRDYITVDGKGNKVLYVRMSLRLVEIGSAVLQKALERSGQPGVRGEPL